jgi:hypothetical protein
VTAPTHAEQGVAFVIQVNQTAVNNGPLSPVNAVESVTFVLPPDCDAEPDEIDDIGDLVAGQSKRLNGMVAGNVIVVPQITFNVTCTLPGLHNFNFTSFITSATGVFDPNLANNSKLDFVAVTLGPSAE